MGAPGVAMGGGSGEGWMLGDTWEGTEAWNGCEWPTAHQAPDSEWRAEGVGCTSAPGHSIQAHTGQLRHVCLVQPTGAWTRWPVPTRLQTRGSGRATAPLEQPRRPRPRPAGAGAAHPLTQSRSQFRSQLRLSARPASRAGLLPLPHLVLGRTPPRRERTQPRAPRPARWPPRRTRPPLTVPGM